MYTFMFYIMISTYPCSVIDIAILDRWFHLFTVSLSDWESLHPSITRVIIYLHLFCLSQFHTPSIHRIKDNINDIALIQHSKTFQMIVDWVECIEWLNISSSN